MIISTHQPQILLSWLPDAPLGLPQISISPLGIGITDTVLPSPLSNINLRSLEKSGLNAVGWRVGTCMVSATSQQARYWDTSAVQRQGLSRGVWCVGFLVLSCQKLVSTSQFYDWPVVTKEVTFALLPETPSKSKGKWWRRRKAYWIPKSGIQPTVKIVSKPVLPLFLDGCILAGWR